MSDVTVRQIDPDTSRELRRSVLRPNLPPGALLPGDDQAGVIHLGGFIESTLVSTCLVFAEACPWLPDRPAWRLRSMASEPAVRGSGAGTAVLAEATEVVRRAGAEIFWCEARQSAVGFYRRAGWRLHGKPFRNSHGPHRFMWLAL